jgi:hypothetical protein
MYRREFCRSAPDDAKTTNKQKLEEKTKQRKENAEAQLKKAAARQAASLLEEQRLAARSSEQVNKEKEEQKKKIAERKTAKQTKLAGLVARLEPGRAGAGRVRTPSLASLTAHVDRM